MKEIIKRVQLFILLMLCVMPFLALAQETGVIIPMEPDVIPPPNSDDIRAFLAAIGGWKTLGTMGIVATLVQGLMIVFRSKLGDFAGKFKLLIVLSLTFVGGVIALKIQGLDWASAMLHPVTLGAMQVLGNQLWKQFAEKEA